MSLAVIVKAIIYDAHIIGIAQGCVLITIYIYVSSN